MVHPTGGFYTINGQKRPSVSTVFSKTNKIFEPSSEKGLDYWKSIEPDHVQIVAKACRRGTLFHSEVEKALKATDFNDFAPTVHPNHQIELYVARAIPILMEIRENKSWSEQVVHHPLGYAGTTDLICTLNGKVTCLDWKTTRPESEVGQKQKDRKYYKKAEIQVAAYGAAACSMPEYPLIEQGAIVVMYDWREPEIYYLDRTALAKRAKQFQERLEVFKLLHSEMTSDGVV